MVFLVVLLRPPPSSLIPNLPHTGRKVSVVFLPSSTEYNLSADVLNAGIPVLTGEWISVNSLTTYYSALPFLLIVFYSGSFGS